MGKGLTLMGCPPPITQAFPQRLTQCLRRRSAPGSQSAITMGSRMRCRASRRGRRPPDASLPTAAPGRCGNRCRTPDSANSARLRYRAPSQAEAAQLALLKAGLAGYASGKAAVDDFRLGGHQMAMPYSCGDRSGDEAVGRRDHRHQIAGREALVDYPLAPPEAAMGRIFWLDETARATQASWCSSCSASGRS